MNSVAAMTMTMQYLTAVLFLFKVNTVHGFHPMSSVKNVLHLHSEQEHCNIAKNNLNSNYQRNDISSRNSLRNKRNFNLKCIGSSTYENTVVSASTVDEILELVRNTDKGASAPISLQKSVKMWMDNKSKEYSESLVVLNNKKREISKLKDSNNSNSDSDSNENSSVVESTVNSSKLMTSTDSNSNGKKSYSGFYNKNSNNNNKMVLESVIKKSDIKIDKKVDNNNKNENENKNEFKELTVLDDINLYGNYDVAFVTTINAAKQQGKETL